MKEKIISRVPLFASLPFSEIEHLAATLGTCEFPENALLFLEGHKDDRLYILLDGKVEIIKALGTPDERLLGVRERGVSLGEMSLFTLEGCHTASVRALTPVSLLEMTRSDFDALLHRQPTLAYEMVRILSTRLENSENLTIRDLQEKNRQLTLAYEELKTAQVQIIEKEKLEHELEIARQIQLSILPQSLPMQRHFDFGANMHPARAVGGDFYDFIPLDDEHLGIVVGDVSDKGVPAALFMALTYSLMRAEARRHKSPGETLRAVNQLLLDVNSSGMFVTVLYGILDYANGDFNYARAGHPPPLVFDRQGGLVQATTGTGQPLGLFEDSILDEQRINIPTGGTALVFSDGLTETADEHGNYFGERGMHSILQRNLVASAQELCLQYREAVTIFSGASPQQDDFTLVSIKRRHQ